MLQCDAVTMESALQRVARYVELRCSQCVAVWRSLQCVVGDKESALERVARNLDISSYVGHYSFICGK